MKARGRLGEYGQEAELLGRERKLAPLVPGPPGGGHHPQLADVELVRRLARAARRVGLGQRLHGAPKRRLGRAQALARLGVGALRSAAGRDARRLAEAPQAAQDDGRLAVEALGLVGVGGRSGDGGSWLARSPSRRRGRAPEGPRPRRVRCPAVPVAWACRPSGLLGARGVCSRRAVRARRLRASPRPSGRGKPRQGLTPGAGGRRLRRRERTPRGTAPPPSAGQLPRQRVGPPAPRFRRSPIGEVLVRAAGGRRRGLGRDRPSESRTQSGPRIGTDVS